MAEIQLADNILLVWSGKLNMETFKEFTEQIREKVGKFGSVSIENMDMLITSNHSQSKFHIIFVNGLQDFNYNLPLNIAAEMLRVLKLCGKLLIQSNAPNDNVSTLKLSGFNNVSKQTTSSQVEILTAFKPDFEVGSSVKLSIGSATKTENTTWKIDLNDDDVQLDNPDDLLTEEDLVRPDPSTLKVCGTTGKRKACKTCVCGLKEELEAEEQEKVAVNRNIKSSCGSCYLGDAFRCASCPYLGMPAFKPGDKVVLTNNTLVDKI